MFQTTNQESRIAVLIAVSDIVRHRSCMLELKTRSRIAGSCFLGGKVADEFHEVLLGNLGNPQAPLLPKLAVSLAVYACVFPPVSSIRLPLSWDNDG